MVTRLLSIQYMRLGRSWRMKNLHWPPGQDANWVKLRRLACFVVVEDGGDVGGGFFVDDGAGEDADAAGDFDRVGFQPDERARPAEVDVGAVVDGVELPCQGRGDLRRGDDVGERPGVGVEGADLARSQRTMTLPL